MVYTFNTGTRIERNVTQNRPGRERRTAFGRRQVQRRESLQMPMDELASIKAGREYASGFNSGMIVGLCAGAFMASVIALILGV